MDCSVRSLLNPKLTASWELGLTRVSEGTVTEEEYLEKLNSFVARNTNNVKNSNFGGALQLSVDKAKAFREAEERRVKEIYHNANSDLQGVPSDEHSKLNFQQRLTNSPIPRFFLQPMANFDSMLRFFGRKSA